MSIQTFHKIIYFLLLTALSAPAQASPYPWSIESPSVSAKAWLLTDFRSGQVLAEHKADERLEPASLTKLMTAYLIFQDLQAGNLKLADRIPVSAQAQAMPGSRIFLEANRRARVEDLVQGLIIVSGNDAAVALAEQVAGTQENFVARMNAQAQKLGMSATRFSNCTGLIETDHYTSARDLNTLGVALMRDFPEFYSKWFGLKEFNYNGITQHNRNALLWKTAGADGLKTGYTRNAGYTLVASAEREGMRLLVTVLGTKNELQRAQVADKLLEFGFSTYETRLLYQGQQAALNVRVWEGDVEQLPIGLERDLYLTFPRGSYGKLQANITVSQVQVAPIEAGQTVGNLVLNFGQARIHEYPLITLRAVGRGNLLQRSLDRVYRWWQ